MAKRASIDPSILRRLERGLTVPSVERLNDIAIALDTDLSDLFNFSERRVEHQLYRRVARTLSFLSLDDVEKALQVLRALFPKRKRR